MTLTRVAMRGLAAETDDPRHVVVEKFEVLVDGRPPIVLKLSTPEEQAAAEKTKLVFKEGQVYRTQVTFRVQHDVVLGLQFTNSVFKMKMRGESPFRNASCCPCRLQLFGCQWIAPRR